MAEVGETPQQKLARIEGRARLAITIIAIICAVALFIEFLLAVTLPVKAGYDTFLSFNRVSGQLLRFPSVKPVTSVSHLSWSVLAGRSQSPVSAGPHRCAFPSSLCLSRP